MPETVANERRAYLKALAELDIETLDYALRSADNWLDERWGPTRFDEDGPVGTISRWNRDNPQAPE